MKLPFVASTLAALALATASRAAILITEVHPTGSSASYASDWFELTNTGASDVTITGWTVDDSSNGTGFLPLRGIATIPAGKSVIFAEGNATGTTDATIQTNFVNAWFGGTAPAGFAMGFYGGAAIGLNSTTDAVNIFSDNGTTRVTGVAFNASTLGTTFDNAAGIGDANLPLPIISTLSVIGANGAFLSATGNETGSPGTITNAVPEPASLSLLAISAAACLVRRRRSTPTAM